MYLLLYTFIIFIINIIYFLLYYYFLNFHFNIYNFLFTTLFAFFLVFTITLSHKLLWKIINSFIILFFALLHLGNVPYYQSHEAFLNPFLFTHFLNSENGNFFIDYLTTIPSNIYIITIIWFIALMLLNYFYTPIFSRIEKYAFGHHDYYNLLNQKIRKHYILYSIILAISLIISNYAYLQYLNNHPLNSWWETAKKDQDYTLWGVLINNFIENTTPSTFAFEIEENNKKETINNKDNKVEINNNLVKKLIDELNAKSNELEHNSIQYNYWKKPNNIPDIKHIIILQLESVPAWAIDEFDNENSPMPFLQKLKNHNYSVKKFIANSCCTINAEFSTLCSYFPNSSGPITESNLNNKNYNCLPAILDQYNYVFSLYHANMLTFWQRQRLYPNWININHSKLHTSPEFNIRESDYNVLNKLANELKIAEDKNEKTFSYFISFTSHGPHNKLYIDLYNHRNGDAPDLPIYNKKIPAQILNNIEINEDQLRIYLTLLNAVDQSIEHFFKQLKQYNLLANSLIIIHGDHRYYQIKPNNNLKNSDLYNKVPFILVLGQDFEDNKASKQIDIAGHINIAPTILDLLNIKIPDHFLGKSLFSPQYTNYSINKCFNKIIYQSKNLVIKGNNKNNLYKIFYSKEKINSDDQKYLFEKLEKIINISDYILNQDMVYPPNQEK